MPTASENCTFCRLWGLGVKKVRSVTIHIAINRIGIQYEELSVQYVDHVAFNKFPQRAHDRAVKECAR